MSTLQEFESILHRLPPAVVAILRLLFNEPLSPQAAARLLALVRLMIGGLGGEWELIRRALVLLARLGKLSPRAVLPVIGTIEAELAAAGGPAAGAGAGALATAAAVLAAVLAVAFAFWSIGSEILKEIELPADGQACGLDTEGGVAMATGIRTLYARGIGGKTALQRAIDRAMEACNEDRGQCGGGECKSEECECRPTLALIDVDIRWRLFWRTAYISYVCPCACLPKA
jgi:hypothetical protein